MPMLAGRDGTGAEISLQPRDRGFQIAIVDEFEHDDPIVIRDREHRAQWRGHPIRDEQRGVCYG